MIGPIEFGPCIKPLRRGNLAHRPCGIARNAISDTHLYPRLLALGIEQISSAMRIVSAEHIASLGKMKQLSELLNTEFGNSLTAKRAQVRNEILVRGDEIQAELAKGWSAAAIWKVLTKGKEITCSYKTFVAHVRRLQHQAATTETKAITPEKRKGFTWDPTPNREELIGSETANPRNRMPESL